MKKSRKLVAMIAALALTATMAAPMAAYADGDPTKGSISISNSVTGHTYQAYQIFDGDYSDGVLANIVWGSGVKDTATIVSEVKALGGVFAEVTDAASIAKVLSTDNTASFAKVVGKHLSETCTEQTEGTYTIEGLDLGYYLVKDKENTLGGANDAYTNYIVKVLGTATNVEPKSALPSVMKKVYENQDDNKSETVATIGSMEETDKKWNDVADYSIGDDVPFKLYGTMPSNLSSYDHYYYKFNDTLGKEFTLDSNTEFEIKVDGVKVNANKYNIHVTTQSVEGSGTTIGVAIEDIKALTTFDKGEGITVTADSVITVEYKAKLNSNAKIGIPGQINAVDLEYSNNPNVEYTPTTNTENSSETPETPGTPGSPESPETPVKPETPEKPSSPESPSTGDKGKTPEDKVIVFTYELDVTKIDAVNAETKLENAEFTMQNEAGKYAKVDTDGKFVGWVEEAEATTLKSDSNGLFKIIGIDEGTYTLTETKAPAGYNLPAGDAAKTTVTIKATTVNNQSWAFAAENAAAAALTKLELGTAEQDTDNHGTASMTITNAKGSTLPSTGGMGTLAFYVTGGVLVAGAGVTLISKKRMKNEE